MQINPNQKLYLPTDPERPSVYCIGKIDHEQKRLVPTGVTGYRASELGRCVRALVLCKLGYQPQPFDEKSKAVMGMGNVLEPAAAQWFEDNFGGVVQRQVSTRMQIWDPWEMEKPIAIVGGVSDGLWFPFSEELDDSKFIRVEHPDAKYDKYTIHYVEKLNPTVSVYGIEIKAPGHDVFMDMLKNGPSETYKIQMDIYRYSMEEILGIRLLGFWFIMIERGTGRCEATCYEEPFHPKQFIVDRILKVEELASKGEEFANCDTSDFFCRYWKFHKEEEGKQKGIFDASLTGLASRYHDLSTQMAELKKAQDSVKESLELAMKGRDKVKTDGFTLFYSSRKRVDGKMLQAANPQMIKKYQMFDIDACLEDNPELKERFLVPGEKFLTCRQVGLTKADKIVKVKVLKGIDQISDEAMDNILEDL